jgi:hypothetical protein
MQRNESATDVVRATEIPGDFRVAIIFKRSGIKRGLRDRNQLMRIALYVLRKASEIVN